MAEAALAAEVAAAEAAEVTVVQAAGEGAGGG